MLPGQVYLISFLGIISAQRRTHRLNNILSVTFNVHILFCHSPQPPPIFGGFHFLTAAQFISAISAVISAVTSTPAVHTQTVITCDLPCCAGQWWCQQRGVPQAWQVQIGYIEMMHLFLIALFIGAFLGMAVQVHSTILQFA